MAKIKATELEYQAVFKEKLIAANHNFKTQRIKVRIKQTGNSLQLRATLPLKPGDKSVAKQKKQYDLSLGIPANLEGLKTAIEESYELGKLIARHTFEWNDKYLGNKSREKQEIKTIGELLEDFENQYYQTRQKTLTSQNTFANYQSVLKRNLPLNYLPTKENLESIINSFQGNKKNELIAVISVFIKTFNLDFTLKSSATYDICTCTTTSGEEYEISFSRCFQP